MDVTSPYIESQSNTSGGDISSMCPPGHSLNLVAVLVTFLILLYFLGFYDNMFNKEFYSNKKDKFSSAANIYDEEYITYPREQSVYDGISGFGRNY
jgi:hypothetical protein